MEEIGSSERVGTGLLGGETVTPVLVRSNKNLLELALWLAGPRACSVIVTDGGSRVLGVATVLDLLKVIDLNGRNPAKALMSVLAGEVARPVPILRLGGRVQEGLFEVLESRERCGVLLDGDDKPIGVVSVLDVLNVLMGTDHLAGSLGDLPAHSASLRLRSLQSDADVRHAISALVARDGEPLAVGSSGFVVTAQSLAAAVLGPQRLREFVEDPDGVLGSYLLYEVRALVRPAVISREMRLRKAVQLMSDSGEQVLRLNDGSFVTACSIGDFFLERLRHSGTAAVREPRWDVGSGRNRSYGPT